MVTIIKNQIRRLLCFNQSRSGGINLACRFMSPIFAYIENKFWGLTYGHESYCPSLIGMRSRIYWIENQAKISIMKKYSQ